MAARVADELLQPQVIAQCMKGAEYFLEQHKQHKGKILFCDCEGFDAQHMYSHRISATGPLKKNKGQTSPLVFFLPSELPCLVKGSA